MSYFTIAKDNMVTNQLMPNHVNNQQILDAFREVPKHEFVEGDWQRVCYSDCQIPLTDNRFMLNPDVQARMIQALNLRPNSTVMDIGCGSGYTSVILSRLSGKVVGVEPSSLLAALASKYITKNNINNVSIKHGEYFAGAQENAPYDAILVNGAVTSVPKALLNQLGKGGKLVCIIRDGLSSSKVVSFEGSANKFSRIELFDGFGEYL